MKNITTYIIFLLMLSFCYSCVKEADTLIEGEPELIPQEGETQLMTGIVRDTSGNLLPKVSVKLILEDLELVTDTDENGIWSLIVPNSLNEGYVVANKIEYSKSIRRIVESGVIGVEDIYLAKELSNTEVDLSFSVESLRTVKGRMIDEDANPIPGVTVFLISQIEDSQMEYVFNGFESTRDDGSFEIIYEDNNFSSTILQTIFSGACSDNRFFEVEGQDPIEDLGNLELPFDNFSIVRTRLESDGTACYDGISTMSYNYNLESSFLPVSYSQPLGDISVQYCPDEFNAFYIGVENDDNTQFNGLFLTALDVDDTYVLDACTPNAGSFLELSINGDIAIYEQDLLFQSPDRFISQNANMHLNFSVLSWATFTPLGQNAPAYQIGKIRDLVISDGNGNPIYTLDEESEVNYVNMVQDDDEFFSGVALSTLEANGGTAAEITLRFRVNK